jgi:hypothetical protein
VETTSFCLVALEAAAIIYTRTEQAFGIDGHAHVKNVHLLLSLAPNRQKEERGRRKRMGGREREYREKMGAIYTLSHRSSSRRKVDGSGRRSKQGKWIGRFGSWEEERKE